MRVNNNYGISMYNLFNTMYQGNVALHNNRLNRNLFPGNISKDSGAFNSVPLEYVNSIKSSSKALSGTLRELSGTAFANRTITSSNTDVMTVSYSGNKPNSVDTMIVKVEQIAAGQMNEGARMNANATFEGSNGVNKFSIKIEDKTTEISVNIAAGDTNKDVQQKMADAINKAGIGIKATVETDSKSDSSILKLESTVTGSNPKNGFTVSDIKGNLSASTGANDVARKGQDAIFSVNGGSKKTSQSNTVSLGNGVSATFIKTSDEAIKISKGKDLNYAVSAVEDMVKSYNDLYAAAAQRTNDPKSQNLALKMVSISKTYSGSLSGIGIGFDNSGRMTIDSKKMNQAAESGKLEQFFKENSGKNYGFTNQLNKLSDNVSRNTSSFVSSSLFGSSLSGNFGYSSFGNAIQYNYLSAGSVFDYMS